MTSLVARVLNGRTQNGVPAFDRAMAMIVVSNLVVLSLDADMGATCVRVGECSVQGWLQFLSALYVLIYILECVARLFVQGKSYFSEGSNRLDFTVVILGILHLILNQFQNWNLAVLNTLQIIRALKMLRCFPPVVVHLVGRISSAVFWGMLILCFELFCFSVVSVHVIYPIAAHIVWEDSPWCGETFSTVSRSMLYFFATLVASDAWGECAVPIIQHAPWTSTVFVSAVGVVQLGFLNWFLVVILGIAVEAKEMFDIEKNHKDSRAREVSLSNLANFMKELDTSGTGKVNINKVLEAYAKNDGVKMWLHGVGMYEDEFAEFLALTDARNSGEVSCDELIRNLAGAKKLDSQLAMMKWQLLAQKVECRVVDRLTDLEQRVQQLSAPR